MFSSYCSWDNHRGALTPVITYWLKLASIVVFWISLALLLALVDPWLVSIFAWNETWAILLAFVDFHSFFVRRGILRMLRLVCLVVTLSVMLLNCWYFNAKYANYLCNCYNQFLWSLLFLLNWSIRLLFNVIITWFVTTYSIGFSSHTIVFFGEFLPGVVIGKTLPLRKPSPLQEHKVFAWRFLIRRWAHRKMVITRMYLRVRCMSLT